MIESSRATTAAAEATGQDLSGSHRLSGLLDQFLSHLEAETNLLLSARDVLEQVRGAILSRAREELESLVSHQMALAEQISGSARQRQELRTALAQQLRQPPEIITVSLLLQYANPVQAERLKQFAQHLGPLARTIDKLSYQNATLARQQMDLFQRLLDCLTGTESDAPRYQSNGDTESSPRRSVFETRC